MVTTSTERKFMWVAGGARYHGSKDCNALKGIAAEAITRGTREEAGLRSACGSCLRGKRNAGARS